MTQGSGRIIGVSPYEHTDHYPIVFARMSIILALLLTKMQTTFKIHIELVIRSCYYAAIGNIMA